LYHTFYQLKEQPFRLTPDPAFMCMTSLHQEALAGLVYSVCTRPGLAVLTGEAGTGKTTTLYALLALLEKRGFVTVLCTNPVMSREELFDFLTTKFNTNCTSTLKNRQLSALYDTLLRHRAEGRPSVLIIDEAHRLPMELLEEVRLLLNLETPQEKLLQIIIAGQPELRDILQRPELRQFKQRVSCQCRLNPLTVPELKEYIGHRLMQAGLPNQTLFSDPVIRRIHEYTDGIPRLVNSLCETALQAGFAARNPQISVDSIDEVARDLDLQRALPQNFENELSGFSEPSPVFHPTAAGENGHNGHAAHTAEDRMPLESYASRQKSLSFFGHMLDRWKPGRR
jgi:general secretion pathway protein A